MVYGVCERYLPFLRSVDSVRPGEADVDEVVGVKLMWATAEADASESKGVGIGEKAGVASAVRAPNINFLAER